MIIILGLNYKDFVSKKFKLFKFNYIDEKKIIPQVIETYPKLTSKEDKMKHSYVDNLLWVND